MYGLEQEKALAKLLDAYQYKIEQLQSLRHWSMTTEKQFQTAFLEQQAAREAIHTFVKDL